LASCWPPCPIKRMEADWSVEIGADLPAIIAPWEGFIDLLREPLLVSRVKETAGFAMLTQALIMLNQQNSPVFTSKCDLWLLAADEIDPLEFDAEGDETKQGIACYIDIIARRAALFRSFRAHERWVWSAVDEMRQVKLTQARAELVVRAAMVDTSEGLAATLYVAACGATENAARATFQSALEKAATITMEQAAITGE